MKHLFHNHFAYFPQILFLCFFYLCIIVPTLFKTNEKIQSNTGFPRTQARMQSRTNKYEFIGPSRLKLEVQK